MSIAPRIMTAPRSARRRGGLARFARAAAIRSGACCSLLMMRRMRTGAGSLSIAIRLWTPSESADEYSIGFRCQFLERLLFQQPAVDDAERG